MKYHIDTGLIKDKFKNACSCPLCQIKKIVEEQFLTEFLNDAVMDDDARISVGKKGFCETHFDMLFARQNKLSLALQEKTYSENLKNLFYPIKNNRNAKKTAQKLLCSTRDCVICELVSESMTKYYKTIAQLFFKEKDFYKQILSTNGFCVTHYAKLLEYSSYAGLLQKEYLSVLSSTQLNAFNKTTDLIDAFCLKHDYRNALKPLGDCENALPYLRNVLYGEKNK